MWQFFKRLRLRMAKLSKKRMASASAHRQSRWNTVARSAKLETEKSPETRKPQAAAQDNFHGVTRQRPLDSSLDGRQKKRPAQSMVLALRTITASWCASARMRDKETLPCLACGSPNMDAFDHCDVCTVFFQAVKAASGCNWKDLSIDSRAASSELHTQLRAADSALDVNKLAVAVFRKHWIRPFRGK